MLSHRHFVAVLTIRQSLLAVRYSPFAVHHLPLAVHHSLSFWLGRSLTLPCFRRLMLALSFFVINYGLKPVA
ncbi:hypothetical protein [Fervidibacter sacchari]